MATDKKVFFPTPDLTFDRLFERKIWGKIEHPTEVGSAAVTHEIYETAEKVQEDQAKNSGSS